MLILFLPADCIGTLSCYHPRGLPCLPETTTAKLKTETATDHRAVHTPVFNYCEPRDKKLKHRRTQTAPSAKKNTHQSDRRRPFSSSPGLCCPRRRVSSFPLVNRYSGRQHASSRRITAGRRKRHQLALLSRETCCESGGGLGWGNASTKDSPR